LKHTFISVVWGRLQPVKSGVCARVPSKRDHSLGALLRVAMGCHALPSAAIIDSQKLQSSPKMVRAPAALEPNT